MLNFIKSVYRGLMEFVLWIIPIAGAIVGGVLGAAAGRDNTFLGVLIGIVVGILIDVLGGGLIATFLSMDEKLQHMDEKFQHVDEKLKHVVDKLQRLTASANNNTADSNSDAKTAAANVRIEKLSDYTDPRDGQKYRIVKIGGKTWMAQNLSYQTGNSWCYGGDNSNSEKYGRLYDWNTAKTACPDGWRLPSREEWNHLVAAAGGNAAGKALKSTSGWDDNGNGTDGYGFSALSGGYRDTDGSFNSIGKYGYWWTASEYGSDNAYSQYIRYDGGYVSEGNFGKGYGYSVRCVKNE